MIERLKSKLTEILGKKRTKLILFGETHGFLDDVAILDELIEIFRPTIFLYELLEETKLISINEQKEFLNQPDEKDFSFISTFGELKKTVELAIKYNIPIMGNDIKNMCRKNKDFLKKTKLNEVEIKNEEEILLKREKRQAEKIIDFIKHGENILTTTGTFHLREDSILLNINENYLIIYPAYEGKQLFEPPEDFNIDKVTLEIKEICHNG